MLAVGAGTVIAVGLIGRFKAGIPRGTADHWAESRVGRWNLLPSAALLRAP